MTRRRSAPAGPAGESTSNRRATPPPRHRLSRGLAAVVVGLRWILVPGWIALAFLATKHLPSLEDVGPSASFQDVIPTDLPALQAERASIQHFGFPLLSRLTVVVRNPQGLSPDDQATLVSTAARIDVGGLPGYPGLLGAIPVLNTAGIFPSSREVGTTGLLYLFFSPETTANHQVDVAHRFVDHELASLGPQVKGITGAIPARVEQGNRISDRLPLVEAGTVVLVALATAIVFRSLGAPLLALGTAAIGYVLSVRSLGWLASRNLVSTPGELEPLIVVLLVGVVTDYSIFYLSSFGSALRSGHRTVRAARRSAATTTPIVAAAALLVASGTALLATAHLSLFASLGPGMAITVLIALLVASTFVPPALALLGRFALWPGGARRAAPVHVPEAGSAAPVVQQADQAERSGAATASAASPGDDLPPHARPGWRRRVARLAVHRWAAALIVVAGVTGLVFAAAPARRLSLGVDLIGGLPRHAEARVAATAAQQGFAPGAIAPTVVVVTGGGIVDRRDALASFGSALRGRPGVAAVIGPDDLPIAQNLGLLRSRDGDAVRYVVVLDEDPYGASAIRHIDDLRKGLPQLVEAAGLGGGTQAAVAGDTALGGSLVRVVWSDAVRVGLLTAVVDLVLLALFLRSLVLPLIVVALSGLVLVTALGLTSWLYEQVLGVNGLAFYLPVAVGVLLVTFGSDYNVFVIGRIWERAERQPFREAIVDGGTEASRAVSSAGVILAVSFALLAIIPLSAFRQFALAMVAGIFIDTFVVRSFVVPAVLGLLGRLSTWPSHRARH